ncbi:ATP-binding protein [Paraburkholderia phosphatilytica]|uniref:ATP-binding protein n=1 Tax=Paraburkholderia phosphatilytica TaxID=2282883 RepID=UPI0013DEFD9A|nr:ATP-binding protein [Paraburkholderia phosphatilytica]
MKSSGDTSQPYSVMGTDSANHDGVMARLVNDFDWSSTRLGPPSDWSASLRMIVRFVLGNRIPMLLWWGPDYIQIYNDAYAPILGAKHPRQALGQPFRECWNEVFDVLGPLVDVPFNGGQATYMDDIELVVRRHGFAEESHFTIAYSPVPDDTAPRGIGGVLATVVEITQRVIGERRLKILGDLGSHVTEAKTAEEACQRAAAVLSAHAKDIPFVLLYLRDDATGVMRLVGSAGFEQGNGPPTEISVEPPQGELAARLAEVMHSGAIRLHDGLSDVLPHVPPASIPGAADQFAVVPIKSNAADRYAGALVAGLSAFIRPDAPYVSFLELTASQIASAVTNARAYEEERRRAEALAQIDRAKTAFFSNVSHEFRTPLTLMLVPLVDALATPDVPAHVLSELEVAHRNAQRLLKLVNSLLDFARIEAGRADALYTPVDLAVLTRDVASSFRSAMERAGLGYHVQCDTLGEPVYVDHAMWERVILNLVSNAFKFTFDGEVRIRLTRGDGCAVFEVADTGVGVPAQELPKLFDRFHRVEGARSRTHEGSGIGLALVQEIVRLHGGTIEVDSEVGVGSTFRVSLPFGTAHIPPEQLRAATALPSAASGAKAYVDEALRWLPGEDTHPAAPVWAEDRSADENHIDSRFAHTYGARILLADDNADMRAYLRDLLGPHYAVDLVHDGEDAMSHAIAQRPDLILADVMMPRLDGFGLIARLRDDVELRDVPVILISARAGEESRIEGLAAGADDYIVKPFYARELLSRVGSLLELARQRREGEARFRAYVQATNDVVYRMSADWREMRQLQGRNFIPDEAGPNQTWLDKYIRAEDQPQVIAAIEQAIRTRSNFELEHPVIRVDGTVGWTFSRAIPLFDDEGNIVEWFGAASDVTERRESHEALQRHRRALEEADRQKNEFLAMLAHELRNPLAPLRNGADLLQRLVVEPATARRTVDIIERQVTQLTRLVDDLLDFSRITQGKIELRRAPQRLDHLIANSLESIELLVRDRNHSIAVHSGPHPLIVNGDPQRLVQCFVNVLTNAAKYTPPSGEIRVRTRQDGDEAVVTISDNGVGIPADMLPRVFDLFTQGERMLDRSLGGLGIGLAVVKRLVEMHGGSITVYSDGLDLGATFEIRLPLAQTETRAKTAATEPRVCARRILVVDDNRDGADVLAELLQQDGHDVMAVYSSRGALEALSRFQPDIILLDIGLPEIDGYELAGMIRQEERLRHVRLIAITGYGQEEHKARAEAAGFAAHLLKPVEFARLRQLLAE